MSREQDNIDYSSSIRLGEKYRSKRYGVEGYAVELQFTEHFGQTVVLERMEGPQLQRTGFDPSEVELVNEAAPAGFATEKGEGK